MKSTLRKKVAIFITTLVLSAIGAEVAYRFYLGWSRTRDLARLETNKSVVQVDTIYLGHIVQLSDQADLIYELKPNLDGKFYGQKLSTNAAGIRGTRNVSREKARGMLRIVGIGDSYMFGQRVADGETYLDQLEHLFKARGRRLEVINLAVPGYNTTMERASLEQKGMQYAPDLIVVGVVGNDWDLPDFLVEGPINRPLGSAMLGKIYQVFHGPPTLAPTPHSNEIKHRFLFSQKAVPAQYQHMVGYSSFINALGRIHHLATGAGAKVVLFSDCLPRTPSRVDCDFHYEQGEKRALWKKIEKWNFKVCSWSLPDELRIPNDGHPTAAGHRELAHQLDQCISPLLD